MMRAQNSLVPAHKCICSTLLRPQWTVRKLRPRNPDRRRRRLVLRPEPRHRFCSFSPRHISDCHTIALVHPRLSRNICHRHSREDSGVCMQLPFSRLRVVSFVPVHLLRSGLGTASLISSWVNLTCRKASSLDICGSQSHNLIVVPRSY